MRKQPSHRDPASPKKGGCSRQSEINHGTRIATEPGATRSHRSDPSTGASRDLMSGTDQLLTRKERCCPSASCPPNDLALSREPSVTRCGTETSAERGSSTAAPR